MGRGWTGLKHLAFAVALGGAVWVGDLVTGRHIEAVLSSFADRLAAWYEAERFPAVLCSPGTKVPYTKLDGVVFDVPQCWRSEVRTLLDRDVHRFYDPEARAGMVSISVEATSTPEDLAALQGEFKALASMPQAIVHEKDVLASTEHGPAPQVLRREATDSLAERIGRPEDPSEGQTKKRRSPSPFRTVETSAVLGLASSPMDEEPQGGYAGRPSSSGKPVAVLGWLLLSDRLAVRVQYFVREDWSTDSVVRGEIKRARELTDSIRPVP